MHLSEPRWQSCMLPCIWNVNASSTKAGVTEKTLPPSMGKFVSQNTTDKICGLANKNRSFNQTKPNQSNPNQTSIITTNLSFNSITFFSFWHSQPISVLQESGECCWCCYECMQVMWSNDSISSGHRFNYTLWSSRKNFQSMCRALGIYLTCLCFHQLPHLLNWKNTTSTTSKQKPLTWLHLNCGHLTYFDGWYRVWVS